MAQTSRFDSKFDSNTLQPPPPAVGVPVPSYDDPSYDPSYDPPVPQAHTGESRNGNTQNASQFTPYTRFLKDHSRKVMLIVFGAFCLFIYSIRYIFQGGDGDKNDDTYAGYGADNVCFADCGGDGCW